MELEQAIQLLKNVVKDNGTNDQKHIDLTLIPVSEKDKYEKALVVAQMAIIEGKITKDEFLRQIHIDN